MQLLPEKDLAMMGYAKTEKGKIYSLLSGRLYSYIDTEHILCKVYVLLTISYPSRTISDNPFCSSSFTWPMAEDHEWTEEFREEMKRVIIDAYTHRLLEDDQWRQKLMDSYPEQLKYDFESPPEIPDLAKLDDGEVGTTV